jgi:hypothetical protein
MVRLSCYFPVLTLHTWLLLLLLPLLQGLLLMIPNMYKIGELL